MGIIPHYDPFTDPSLSWVVARVISIDPPAPTWSRPATVVLDVEEVLRGAVPPRIDVLFDAPREAGQTYFYLERDLLPTASPEAQARAAEQRALLDARPVEVPSIGERIVTWVSPAPGLWRSPTLRSLGSPAMASMRSRWIPADDAAIAQARARLGR